MRKAFTKFGFDGFQGISAISSPQILKTTSAATNGSGEEGEVPTTGTQNDAEFVSPVSVGGQTVIMDFDTGSSDMCVMFVLELI